MGRDARELPDSVELRYSWWQAALAKHLTLEHVRPQKMQHRAIFADTQPTSGCRKAADRAPV